MDTNKEQGRQKVRAWEEDFTLSNFLCSFNLSGNVLNGCRFTKEL
jgi:hypothetical protein